MLRKTEGQAVPLKGLPIEGVLKLIEFELDRSLTDEEQDAVSIICSALHGNPGDILQSLVPVLEEKLSLPEVAKRLTLDVLPREAVAMLIMESVSGAEWQIIEMLAAHEGAPLHVLGDET